MLIASSTDPKIEPLCIKINNIAQEAIQWFDTARKIDRLADTHFTFVLTRYIDAREHVEIVDEKMVHIFDFYKEITESFKITRGGGEAFDIAIDQSGKRSKFETMADFPRQPTASLPVDQIITVNELTADILLALKEHAQQKITKIDLKVELFDLYTNHLDGKEWRYRCN